MSQGWCLCGYDGQVILSCLCAVLLWRRDVAWCDSLSSRRSALWELLGLEGGQGGWKPEFFAQQLPVERAVSPEHLHMMCEYRMLPVSCGRRWKSQGCFGLAPLCTAERADAASQTGGADTSLWGEKRVLPLSFSMKLIFL